jgi:NTE family protein
LILEAFMDITLALGGGGSRGVAHIGVLRGLEQLGCTIRAVAGSSAGGIVAAVYAAGYSPDEIAERFARVDQSRLLRPSFSEGPGLLGLSTAARVLEEVLGKRTFADLRIPCALTSVDVKSGQELILTEGRLLDAVLATIALPAIFPPQERGPYQLVDGGVLDPVPVRAARALAPSLPVVAVVLTPLIEPAGGFAHLGLPIRLPGPIAERITRLHLAQVFNIFIESMDAEARMLTELRLQLDTPEVVIRPEVGGIGLLDRVDVQALVGIGEQAAAASLPEIKRVLSWSRRIQRRVFPRRLGA